MFGVAVALVGCGDDSPGGDGDGPQQDAGLDSGDPEPQGDASDGTGGSSGQGGSGSGGMAGGGGMTAPEDASVPDASDDAGPGDADVPEPGENVFDRDILHEVEITVAESDLPILDQHTDIRVPATLVFDGETLTEVGVRNKGQTSFQPSNQKPSFSLKFNQFVQGQKLDGLKRLTINNTVQDTTWANELLTYDTYRKAGLPAPRVSHAVVSLNGVPKGIYTIIEAYNADFMERHYGADFDQGNLYEGPWDFTKSVDEIDLKDEVEEMRTRDDLRALTDIVLSEADATYPDRLATVLDVDQFILGYAVDVATVAWDGYAYCAWNFYLYNHPGDDRFVFFPAGANWPHFLNVGVENSAIVDPDELPALWGESSPTGYLANRVMDVPALRERYEEHLKDVMQDAFDVEALHAEFDRLRTVLHSTDRTDEATTNDLQTFDDNIDKAYDFVTDRKAYMTEQGY